MSFRQSFNQMAAAIASTVGPILQEVGHYVTPEGILGLALAYYLGKVMIDVLDPRAEEKKNAQKSKEHLKSRLMKKNQAVDFEIDEYESLVAQDVIDPDSIEVHFEDIGGLDEVKRSLREIVILPFLHPELFQQNSLLTPPKGILFYGPPGTGKTMLAKAVAKETHATFINVKLSMLQDKYFGESQKRARALFSLAHKIAPCIIFIDEIDSFLRERSSTEDPHLSNLKAEFMSAWDGLETDDSKYIIVIGATNRPYDVDSAIQRRLPRQFLVELPDTQQRNIILRTILKKQSISPDFDFEIIARKTQGYSGSDLKELLKHASLSTIRHALQSLSSTSGAPVTPAIRPLSHHDVLQSLKHVPPTGQSAQSYQQKAAIDKLRQLTGQGSPRNQQRDADVDVD